MLNVKGKGKGPFYLTSVVPSVLQTRDCYQWKPTVIMGNGSIALKKFHKYYTQIQAKRLSRNVAKDTL